MPKTSSYISIPGLLINKKNKVPAYKQVYEGLRIFILNGQLRSGDRLPSSRILSEDIGVSRNIVLLAYEQLQLEGYIVSGVGAGTYVAKNIVSTFSTDKKVKKDNQTGIKSSPVKFVYPLAGNSVPNESTKEKIKPFQNAVTAFDHFPYKTWQKCAFKVYKNLESLFLGYEDAQGYLHLRVAIANYLRTNRGLHCEPEQVVITNGTQQSLNITASLILKKGDRFWMEDPGYNHTKATFMHYGGKPFYIPLTKHGININWGIKYCPKPTAVYLTPSNQFPIGGTIAVSKRIQLLHWAHKNKVWLIEDDYDSEFRYIKKPIPALQGLDNYKRVIYIGSFSKILFPGIRIGYIVLPDREMAKEFTQAKAFADRQSAITGQAILCEFISQGFLSTHLRKMRVLYKKRHDYAIEVFEKYAKGLLRVEKQNSGIQIICWLNAGLDDKKIAAILLTAGIYTIPVSTYSVKHKVEPGLILGFAAFNETLVKEYALKLISLLRKYMNENNIEF